MKVIICLDTRGGICFNGRRLSRDRRLTEDIAAVSGGVLRISPYSLPLFPEDVFELTVGDDYLEGASEGEYCFVERETFSRFLPKIEEIVVYCWNRDYPSDVEMDFVPYECGFRLSESAEFKGSSHDRITKEVFLR